MKLNDLEDVANTACPLMAGFDAPWFVAGGWALDLFLGRATRPHADVELAVFRQDQSRLHAHLSGWRFTKFVDGDRLPWRAGEWLALPVHEVHARSLDEPSRSIEFLLNERDGGNWVFRRNPAITLPLSRAVIISHVGVPTLAPEIVLLFKAKSPRAKDEDDFRAAGDALDYTRRQWLRAALRECHPGHPWIALVRIDAGTSGDAV